MNISHVTPTMSCKYAYIMYMCIYVIAYLDCMEIYKRGGGVKMLRDAGGRWESWAMRAVKRLTIL